jgi:hypothetical protein
MKGRTWNITKEVTRCREGVQLMTYACNKFHGMLHSYYVDCKAGEELDRCFNAVKPT